MTRPPLPTLPADVPSCEYRGGLGSLKCYCSHKDMGRGGTVSYDQCRACSMVKIGSENRIDKPRTISHKPPNQKSNNTWRGSFRPSCHYLGEVLHEEPCTCGSATKIAVHQCGEKYKRCVLTEADKRKVKDEDTRNTLHTCQGCPLYTEVAQWISQEQFADDIRALIAKLPHSITRIAGISRSGVRPAIDLAMHLHLPWDVIDQAGKRIESGGHGWRLKEGAAKDDGIVLVVDDTCMTGNSLRDVSPWVREHYEGRDVRFATVYCNPLATKKPDIFARHLPWPHLLEWNLFNSVLIPSCAFDFDGILCHDCPPEDDDDAARYRQWLKDVKPLYHVRKRAIPLIVTARLEKYREPTLEWLERHGMSVTKLVMGPWESKRERNAKPGAVAEYKAEHYREFLTGKGGLKPKLFVESCPHQAKRIAELSGGLVLCPAARRCFP